MLDFLSLGMTGKVREMFTSYNNCLGLLVEKQENLRIIQGMYDATHKKSILKDTNFRRALKQLVL